MGDAMGSRGVIGVALLTMWLAAFAWVEFACTPTHLGGNTRSTASASGGGGSVPASPATPSEGSPSVSSFWPAVSQAQLPSAPVDVPAAWNAGDQAFRAGDYPSAQRHFGLVFLADPTFQGGQIQTVLGETCRNIGNDCFLVMGRLDLLRLEYANVLGPRAEWVPQMEADYRSILTCYDEALAGRFDSAIAAGQPVVSAPLPVFAQLAYQCVDRSQIDQQQMAELAAAAQSEAEWMSNYSSFEESGAELVAAIESEDWDAIVDTYPGYKLAEEPIIRLVEGGELDGHPRIGDEVERAREILATVSQWEATDGTEYEAMRDAVEALEENVEYAQAFGEYVELVQDRHGLEEENESLELALEATSGSERRSVERRLEANESEIRQIRRQLRRLNSTMNGIREDYDLPERDTPYGAE
jgi:hypothetical protein